MSGVNIELTAKVDDFQRKMGQAEQSLVDFRAEAKRSTAAMGGYVDANGRMRDANGKFVKGAQAATGATKDLAGSMGALNDLALPMAAGFASLTLGVATAVVAFRDFEAVLNEVKAVSGASASEMAALKEQALDLGAATQFSAREAAQAQSELAKSGMAVNQVLAATPGVLSLAAAGQLQVARAAEITGAQLNAFGLSADKATYVADLLAKTANASALSVEEVGESMKYAATVAGSTSQSIEDVSTFLAVLGNAGIKGSQGGTVFRTAIASLAKPSDDAAQKLHNLGISIEDTNGKMLPLADIIGQLREKTAGLTEVQRANAVATIFGTEAMSGIMAVMKQSPDQVEAVASQFRNVTGAAEDMASTMNSGVKGAIEQAMGSIDTAMTTVGEQFAPTVTAVAQGIQGTADAVNKLAPQMKSLIASGVLAATAFTGTAAAVTPLVLGFSALGGAAGVAAIALNPVTLGIASLSLAVAAATVVLKANADATAAAKKAEDDARKARIESTTKVAAQKAELEKLATEYSRLADKSKLSKEEQKRLKEIQDKLAKDVPELAKVVGNSAASHDQVEQAVRREIAAKADLLKQAQVMAKAIVMTNGQDLSRERQKLDELRKRRQEALDAPSYGDKTGKIAELQVIDGMINAQQRAVDAVNQRTLASAAELQRVNSIVLPAPTATKKRKRGGVVDAPETKAKKGEDPEKKAHDEAVKRLQGIQDHFSDLNADQQAWGYGMAGEINTLNALIQRVKKEGLDKYAEGLEVIENAQHRITQLQGAAALKGQEKAKADDLKRQEEGLKNIITAVQHQMALEKGLEASRKATAATEEKLRIEKLEGFYKMRAEVQASYEAEMKAAEDARREAQRDASADGVSPVLRKAMLDEADAAYKAAEAVANYNREIGNKATGKAFAATVRDMQGALVGLALDPSMERIADFAEDLAADEGKLKAWGNVLTEIGVSFKEAGGGAEGFEAAASAIGSAMDPVSLAITGAALAVKALAGAFEDAARKQDSLRDSVVSTATAIRDAQAQLSGDPKQIAEAERLKKQEVLNEKLLAEIEERKNSLMSGPSWAANNIVTADMLGQNLWLNATVGTSLSDLTIDNFTDKKDEQLASLALYDKEFQDAVKRAEEASDDVKEALTPLKDGIAEAFDEAAEAALDAAERIVEIQDEIARGGRDSWGNRISLESETLLKIQEEGLALEEKKAQALKKQAELVADIAKINKDERQAIAEIQNEGSAVRADSETQDKAKRIAKVKAEAQANRDAKTAEINGISEQMKKEQEAHDKAVSNIRILGQERVDALRLEADELQKVINKANDLARAYAKSRSSGGGASSSAANNTTGEKYGDTSGAKYDSSGRKVAYTKNGVNYYHTGATVPELKPGEQHAVVKENEFILTPPQMNNLLAAAGRGGDAPVSEAVTRGVNAMVNAYQRGTFGMPASIGPDQAVNNGGNFSMGDVHLAVYAAPGQDERALIERIYNGLSRRIQRSGFMR